MTERTTETERSTGFERVSAIALVLAVLTGATVAGTAVAASDASISPAAEEPGATTTHTVTVTVGEASAGSWTGLAVNYTGTDAQVGDVGAGDVKTIGIDRGDDAGGATTDVNVSNDLSSVSSAKDGRLLTVGLGGNYALEPGDEVVVAYEDAQNPSTAGAYDIELDVNFQSSGGTATSTLDVGSTADDGGGDADDGSDGNTGIDATDTDDSGDDASNGDDSDGGDSSDTGADTDGTGDGGSPIPGFGLGVAAVALAVVAVGLRHRG